MYVLLPLRAKFSISPARKEISSSDTATKSYSALATTWSSSPLAQLVLSINQIKIVSKIYKKKMQIFHWLWFIRRINLFTEESHPPK